MSTMREVIDHIGKSSERREQCLQILHLWSVAEETGYEPADIDVFAFKDRFLSKDDKFKFSAFRGKDQLKKSGYHNCVKLKNGYFKPIPLTKKPKDLP